MGLREPLRLVKLPLKLWSHLDRRWNQTLVGPDTGKARFWWSH